MKKTYRWITEHAIALLVVFITLGFGITAAVIIDQGNDSDAATCDAFKRSQTSDRLLIDTVLEDSEGGSIPLLDVPAYEALPASMKTYLNQLAAAFVPDPDDPPSLAERLANFRENNLGADDLPEFCT